MTSPGAPEEQRFDFAVVSGDTPDEGTPGASLLRRLEEVAAVAHGERPARAKRRSDSAVASDPDSMRDEPFETTNLPVGRVGEPDEPEIDVDEASDEAEALTVAQFYDRVKRALAQAFDGEVWVTGEIRGLRESRGHRYIELADESTEGGGRGAAQQLEVVCWAREWPPVAAALAEAGVDLETGRVVRVRGKVSVWEGGSKLRFTLTALDVEALLGGIAAARRRLLQALEREGLLGANEQLVVPLVPLHVGVVTSPGSEAHRDFVGQLERSGYAFSVHLEPSLVQGPEAPRQVAAALGRMAFFAPDLVVVVRGGGARGDLAAFDSEEVARAIATAPFPVWTGIGHTGDRSVADEVAQRALITPTACGEAVVGAVGEYWNETMRKAGVLSSLARARLDTAVQRLHSSTAAVTRGARFQLDRRSDEIAGARALARRGVVGRLDGEASATCRRAAELGAAGRRALSSAERLLRADRQVLNAYDPGRQMERGWSLTRDGSGRLVRAASQLRAGSEITTRFVDGEVVATVSRVAARGSVTGEPDGPARREGSEVRT